MNISFIEWIVYGFPAYASILMLIISTIKEVPDGRSQGLIRVIFLMPGIICNGILASSGVSIILQTTSNTIKDLNSSTVWTESTTNLITLQGPIWQTVHYMFMIVLIVYVIMQILNIVTKEK